MKPNRLTILFLVLVIAILNLNAQTYVNGNITTTTWTKSGSPYIVIADATVLNGNTLTIEPSVMVKFALGTSLNVDGVLSAIGAVGDSIIFTTNEPNPIKSQWGNIKFTNLII